MARRPQRFTEDDFESLEGRASKTEQKKAVQRMAALGEQLAQLSAKQIQKITSMCGAKIPAALKSQLLKYENDDEAVKEIGIEHALLQAKDLLKNGLPGIHFYILNKSYSTKKILEQLSIKKKPRCSMKKGKLSIFSASGTPGIC